MPIIKRDKSIIPACDFSDIVLFESIVRETADIDAVGAYKIGFRLGYRHSVPLLVETARKHTKKPIIFDHQKAATDIPDFGKDFAQDMKDFGIDAIILFPQAGPVTQEKWTSAAMDAGLGVIIGGEMTHHKYKKSDGGYLDDDALEEIYTNAAEQGVIDFVVPGNKLDRIKKYKELLENKNITPTFYSPGLVTQGGNISEATKVAGDRWHAIVGRAIHKADNIKQAAEELTSQL